MFGKYRDIPLSYFYLNENENDKIIKDYGSYCAEFYLTERSLFYYYLKYRDLSFILFFYAFIIIFNSYLIPIKANPDNYNETQEKENLNNFINLFEDLVFTYANSFLYVELWIIDYIKNKILWKIEEVENNVLNEIKKTQQQEINKINEIHKRIIDKLVEKKDEDSNRTYCEVIDNCEKGSCGCVLHHFLAAWDDLHEEIDIYFNDLINDTNNYFDNLYNYTKKQFEELKNYVKTAFNQLKEYTKQLFQIRLFWTFVLTAFFTKLPFLAIRLIKKSFEKEELSKIDKALILIVENRHKDIDEIKRIIQKKLKVSKTAVDNYFLKLKRKGLIWYKRGINKVVINKDGWEKYKYLINKYNIISIYDIERL